MLTDFLNTIDRPDGRAASESSPSESFIAEFPKYIIHRFVNHYPLFFAASFHRKNTAVFFIRQAHKALKKDRPARGYVPAAILRRNLEKISCAPTPQTAAGVTAIAPRKARVWWDAQLLRSHHDVLEIQDALHFVLRFYDITDVTPDTRKAWGSVFDVDINLNENGKTIDFWAANRKYRIELGIVDPDGRFSCITSTNELILPRESSGGTGNVETAAVSVPPATFNTQTMDDEAKQWSAMRADQPYRDITAETAIHILYRSFASKGHRALRCSIPTPSKSKDALLEEFIERNTVHKAQLRQPAREDRRPIMYARLDATNKRSAITIEYPLVPVTPCMDNML